MSTRTARRRLSRVRCPAAVGFHGREDWKGSDSRRVSPGRAEGAGPEAPRAAAPCFDRGTWALSETSAAEGPGDRPERDADLEPPGCGSQPALSIRSRQDISMDELYLTPDAPGELERTVVNSFDTRYQIS